jgi:hypothetical protein
MNYFYKFCAENFLNLNLEKHFEANGQTEK